MKHRIAALIVCVLLQTAALGTVDWFAPLHRTILVSLNDADDPKRIVDVLNSLPNPPRHVKVNSVGDDRKWVDIAGLFIGLALWSAIIIGLYHLSEGLINRCLVLKKTRHGS